MTQPPQKVLFRKQGDGETASAGLPDFQHVTLLQRTVRDDVGRGVLLIVGVTCILIQAALVFPAPVQEIQFHHGRMPLAVALPPDKPVGRALGPAGHRDVLRRLRLKVLRVVPVHGHVTDQLERVVVFSVVLRRVGRHLKRTVHHQVQGQLAAERRMDVRRVAAPLAQTGLENPGGIVHRTALQTGEGKDHRMVRFTAPECLVFRAPGALVAHHVRIGAAQTRGTDCLVRVHHDMVPGRLLHAVQVVVVDELAVVVFAPGDDITHITALHRIVPVLVHQLVGCLQVTLVIPRRGARLVVHHQFHPLRVGVLVQPLDVEVGIGGHEVEHVVLAVTEPVLPAFVPPFHENLVKVVLRRKVDVLANLRVRRPWVPFGRHLL